MASSERIPTATFDGSLLAPAERLAEFSRLTPGYDKLFPDGESLEDFSILSHGWLLDDLVVTTNTASPIDFRRTAAHIADYPRDTYTLVLLREGSWWTEIDGTELQVAPGETVIMDFTVPWHVHGNTQQNVMMVLPQAVLHAAVPDAPKLHGQVLQGSSGRLFADHLLALTGHLPNLPQRDVTFIRSATLCLLSNAVAALPNATPRPAASRALPIERIRAFIDAHLTDPELSPVSICRELGVTRSTLYRAFSPIGGVITYIQCRRLEAARDSIAGSGTNASIAEVADTYQFSSPAHFSTIFRRQFGVTPRDARDVAVPANPGALFDTWLDVLSRTLETLPAQAA